MTFCNENGGYYCIVSKKMRDYSNENVYMWKKFAYHDIYL